MARLRRILLGRRHTVAGTVYGTIIVLSILAAGAKTYRHQLWHLAAIAGGSAIVLWLAHVYSHGLGESLKVGRRLNAGELARIARREYAIVLAAVAPITAVLAGAVGIFGEDFALVLAFALGLVTLLAQGVRYSKLERLGRSAAVASVALNLTFGLALVAIEVLVAH